MRWLVPTTVFLIIWIFGCSSPTSRTSFPQSAAPKAKPALTEGDAAIAAAILNRLGTNDASFAMYRKAKGTLFLENVSPEVVNAVIMACGSRLPQFETNMVFFHEYRDIRSGKIARLVRAKRVTGGEDVQIIRVTNGFSLESGSDSELELRRVDGRWKVVGARITGIW